MDIVCFNRYYSWYSNFGHLNLISFQLDREMKLWHNITGKLLLMTEYGADAVAGLYQVGWFVFIHFLSNKRKIRPSKYLTLNPVVSQLIFFLIGSRKRFRTITPNANPNISSNPNPNRRNSKRIRI